MKQQLLSEFNEYLDAAGSRESEPDESGRVVDLYSVLQELVALKTEVKIEARQFKSALDHFQSALDQLTREKADLSQMLDQQRSRFQKEQDAALRAFLLQILDIRDRIHEGSKAAENYRKRGFSLCRHTRERAVIEGFRNGQSLTLKRLDQLLASHHVLPIAVMGMAFDPVSMRCAEIEHRSDLENGRVTGELRAGYRWRDEILRVAEVKVNKVE
jgi:molecular chaperone GrpE